MVELKYTPLADLPKIRDELRATFRSGKTRPLAWRRAQLYQFARMMQENADAFVTATHADLGRPAMEVVAGEVGPATERALQSAAKLEEWARPETPAVPDWQKSWRPTINKKPKGVVLSISPWNYPTILTTQPLIGAIAAGCCVLIKPSEIAPSIAQLFADLVPRYLDPSAYKVVNGGVEETTKLLEMQWDHSALPIPHGVPKIKTVTSFYTGNGRIGRVIAAAAAKHLTPVSLELGGKSPVILDSTTDLTLAAKRILYGKTTNAGQICVAPDYVLVPRARQEALVAALRARLAECYPEGALASASFGRIVSALHHARLRALLGATRGEVVAGGKTDDGKGFEPTVVKDVRSGDSLLSEEIFGPILPLVPVEDVDEAIAFIEERPNPLVLYVFTEDEQLKKKIVEETTSGNLVFNDTFQQLAVAELPFSGVGESGYGVQIMKYSFDGFTQVRSTVDIPKEAEKDLEIRYAPYTDEKLKIITGMFQTTIPSSA